jgi:catechol 2,3-dioxygenase-like lactoylglutathione lyase family enzyme
MPIRTHGLSHVALSVSDPERSAAFYVACFGGEVYFRSPDQVQVKGPGEWDVLAFDRRPEDRGKVGGFNHIGFRLADPSDIDEAVETILAAGGRLKARGAFAPGVPYAFLYDLDGNEIEVWFE